MQGYFGFCFLCFSLEQKILTTYVKGAYPSFRSKFLYEPDIAPLNENVTHSAVQVEYQGQILALSVIVPIQLYNQTAYSIVAETHADNRYSFFTEKILFHKFSDEILQKFSIFAKKNKKEFGMISNREEDSLFLLLEHFNLFHKNYFNKKFVFGGDKLLGGKPGLVQFEKFVNKNQTLIYIGDSIIDFQTMVNFNKTYGKGLLFGVILPSKFEFNEEKIQRFDKQFKMNNVVSLSHKEICQVLRNID